MENTMKKYWFYIKKEDRSGNDSGNFPGMKPSVTEDWSSEDCADLETACYALARRCDWYENYWEQYGLKHNYITVTKIFESDEHGRPIIG